MAHARRRRRSVARSVAVLAALLAVADLFRWGNRWYVSTRVSPTDELYAAQLLELAHLALVGALLWTLLAMGAAAVGWRLRVVRHHDVPVRIGA